MSSAFKVAGEVYCGTNGAVAAYVEVMAEQAVALFGIDAPITTFLQNERDSFLSGKIVYLDGCIQEAADRERLLMVLDAATAQLLREETFSQYGMQWVASVVGQLRERIAGGVT